MSAPAHTGFVTACWTLISLSLVTVGFSFYPSEAEGDHNADDIFAGISKVI
ncbi:hypothetical protein ANO11243_084410 [Dothideomycetidae sp. 11243]|nr:hypothetical protein ANO11243_084410 [fungal sp. No.11243]